MQVGEHIDVLRREGPLLAAAADRAGLDAAVPTCPGWVVRDLVRHLGGVHRWATGYVRERRTEPWDFDQEAVAGDQPDGELIDWFRDGHRTLVATLVQADPALECWTYLRAPSPLAMWVRRQTHETAIHRVDAEAAAGDAPSPFPPLFAADGIDELLSCFITRPGGPLRADPPRTLGISATDTPGDWLVRIGADGVETSGGAGEADCDVSGDAADLYLTLWNRQGTDGLKVEGDGDVLALFLDRVHIRWR